MRRNIYGAWSSHEPISSVLSLELLELLATKLTRKSKISVAITAEATSSLWRVLLLPCMVTIQDLVVSSSMKSSHAFEKTIGASPEIIFTSSPDFFMIFLILARGNEWGPVLADKPPLSSNPEYLPACLMSSFGRISFWWVMGSCRKFIQGTTASKGLMVSDCMKRIILNGFTYRLSFVVLKAGSLIWPAS